ncbi:MAG: hypothetical protein ABJ057_00380 [Erythrobacter sp.]
MRFAIHATLFAVLACGAALQAQQLPSDNAPTAQADEETVAARTIVRDDGSEEIDIQLSVDDLVGPPPPFEECTEEQEAAIISGEIIVCRRVQDQRRFRTLDPEGALARFAEETAFSDDPRTPDFISDCHDQGWPAGCVRFGSVPEPALIIDVEALPQAPPGSDADRISRGLPPLGQDDTANGSIVQSNKAAGTASPEESEAPVAPQ